MFCSISWMNWGIILLIKMYIGKLFSFPAPQGNELEEIWSFFLSLKCRRDLHQIFAEPVDANEVCAYWLLIHAPFNCSVLSCACCAQFCTLRAGYKWSDFLICKVEHYYEVIKEPMDFGTISTKLNGGSYKTLKDFEVCSYSCYFCFCLYFSLRAQTREFLLFSELKSYV